MQRETEDLDGNATAKRGKQRAVWRGEMRAGAGTAEFKARLAHLC